MQTYTFFLELAKYFLNYFPNLFVLEKNIFTSLAMNKLQQEQFLPITLHEAWAFFSKPSNLNLITPDSVNFRIQNNPANQMYEGMIICYKISPFLNLYFDWVTEITHIKESSFFVDEQRKGPYKIWHHEHHFKECEGGVLMTDILHYDIGKSVIGWLAGKIVIHKKVKEIFDYRREVIDELFKNKTHKNS